MWIKGFKVTQFKTYYWYNNISGSEVGNMTLIFQQRVVVEAIKELLSVNIH